MNGDLTEFDIKLLDTWVAILVTMDGDFQEFDISLRDYHIRLLNTCVVPFLLSPLIQNPYKGSTL